MDVRGYVEANASEFIDDLKQWLTIPSISADPARHGDVGHSAAWLAGQPLKPEAQVADLTVGRPGHQGIPRRDAVGLRRAPGRGALRQIQGVV